MKNTIDVVHHRNNLQFYMHEIVFAASLFLSMLVASSLFGQVVIDTTNPVQFGIFAHSGINYQNTGGFSQLGTFKKPYSPFGNGNGDIVSFGAEVSAPLSTILKATELTSSIHLAFRIGFNVLRSQLTANEATTFIVNGSPTPGNIQYTLDARFASFGAEPMIEITPFGESLRLHVGTRFAWMYSSNFLQIESISNPSKVVFTGTDKQERMRYEAEIPNANSVDIAGLFGISYDIKLNKRFSIAPEIFYQLPISRLTNTNSWTSSAVRIGSALRITIPTTKPTIRDTIYDRDTLFRAVPDLLSEVTEILSTSTKITKEEAEDAQFERVTISERYARSIPKKRVIETAKLKLDLYRVDHDSTITILDTLVCNEIIWNDFHPLLNYVFFDENSTNLDIKYVQLDSNDAEKFKINNDNLQIETYYNVLNIIGQGMRKDPKSAITIVGCVSQKELKSHADPTKLANNRAKTVANYLINNWNVDESKISIVSRGIPLKPSNEKNPEGVQENQRVEIYTENQELLEPVMLRDTVLSSDIVKLRLKSEVTSLTPIISWQIGAEQDKRVLFARKGDGTPPDEIDIELDRAFMRRLERGTSMDITFDLWLSVFQDKKGDVESKIKVPVKIRQFSTLRKQNTEIDRYILMLFEFGKDNLTASNAKLVRYIRGRIEDAINVGVIGTTDRLGNPEYNKKLSERRAKSVAKVLEFPGAKIVGAGIDEKSYDNSLPEGRFHARTVKIEVEHEKALSDVK